MRGQLRSSLSFSNKPDPERIRNLVSDMLSSRGFNEIMNNSLTRSKYADESPWLDAGNSVFLLNPLSQDLNVMRQTLLFGGLETLAWNQNRKAPDLKLFEFGRIYKLIPEKKNVNESLARYDEHEHLALWITGKREPESWRIKDSRVDYFDLKASVHSIFERIGISADRFTKSYFTDELFEEGTGYAFNNITLVRFGKLKKKELKRFDLKQDVMYANFDWEKIIGFLAENVVSYTELAKFPEVRRDLAIVLDSSIKYEDLEHAAYHAEKYILKGVSLFDVYQGDKIGPGKKSYALSFLLRDDEKTLTDQIIDKTMEKILRTFREKFHATIR
jgi:phenylalanyl-tRNA synthetase beta chain